VFSIELLDCKGQKTRKGVGEGGNAEHHREAKLHGVTLVESGKEEHDPGEETS